MIFTLVSEILIDTLSAFVDFAEPDCLRSFEAEPVVASLSFLVDLLGVSFDVGSLTAEADFKVVVSLGGAEF